MKTIVTILLLASLGANFWQLQHTSEMEESWGLQKTTVAKQKKLLEQATKDLTAEKQSSARTVKSAQGLLDRSEKLMHEIDRLAAENLAYRQRFEAFDAAARAELAAKPVIVAVTPTPSPSPLPTPTPTPTPANGKKKR